MIDQASTAVATPRINYSVVATDQGWQLTAWEPAVISGSRMKPFLWKYSLEFETLSEAHRILEVILGEYGDEWE